MTANSGTEHVDASAVDFAALAAWMDEQGLPTGPIEDVAPVGGGTQNVMLRFQRGGAEYVLRRGPLHLRARSDDAIRREARVLTALTTTDVPAPRVVAACPDAAVIGAAFYLMAPVNGFNAATAVPEPFASDPALRHEMGLGAVTALATLGAVDHEQVGLTDLGHPDGFLERQVPRWLRELDSYNANAGYPGSQLPELDDTASWLEANRPPSFAPGIMHGDYHLANLMYAHDRPQLAAIVDWEMCTIGDPLLDLGWLIATWPAPKTVMAAQSALGKAGGLPTAAELIAHYAERSERDLDAIAWYTVLACFKLAIVLEGTFARSCAGKAPESIGQFLHAIAVDLFERAVVITKEGVG
jgi:aminoglycoside phosphotransferase (APT) family kinase protein